MIFLIIINIIAIISLIGRYIHIKAHILSRSEYRKQAARDAYMMEHYDPFITCDFCGGMIDTRKDTVCPHCGSSYGNDAEWQRRHQADYKQAEDLAREAAEKQINEADQKARKTLRHLRVAIVILICTCFFASLLRTALPHKDNTLYAHNETPLSNFSGGKKTSYNVTGDNTIMESHGVTVSVVDFYTDSDDFKDGDVNKPLGPLNSKYGRTWAEMKIGIRFQNNNDEKVYVKFDLAGINGGAAAPNYSNYYEWLKPHSDATTYDEIFFVPAGIMKEIVFGNFEIHDSEYNSIYKSDNIKTIETDADYDFDTSTEIPDGAKELFNNNGIKVSLFESPVNRYGDDDNTTILYIKNDNPDMVSVSSTDFTVNGELIGSDYDEPLRDCIVPAGYTLFTPAGLFSGISYDIKKEDIKEAEFSLSFKFPKKPSSNFSTDFLELK
ncbi:MAG: hypothetical protein VZR23_01535 [Lachnospiraceae bacterium]|nr:hypothetical protein [Lachnospiraceae bacterium]